MEVKEMRVKLKDVMDIVPRSNEDVVKAYNEKFLDTVDPEVVETKELSTNQWTYIGAGDSPPHLIKFMGIQVFMRGQPTTVTDPLVLEKIKNNHCFVKGEIDKEEMYANDELEKKRAEKRREEDLKLQIEVERQYRKAE